MSLSKFYSYKICGKREGEPYYRAYKPTSTVGGGSKCPNGYKVCGTGQPDHQSCVRDNHLCPLNDIIISESTSTVQEGYSQAMLDGGMSVTFSSQSTGMPIVRMRLTEEQPCADPTQYTASRGRYLYRLLRQTSYYSCSHAIADSYTDSRYDKIGSVREDRLYEDNGLTYVLVNLPQYPHADEKLYNWNLYTNPYYAWSADCEASANLDTKYVIQQADKSVRITSTQSSIMVMSIVFLVMASIFSCISCGYKMDDNDYDSMKSKKLLETIIAGLYLILALLIAWYIFSCIGTINSFNIVVHGISSAQCSDSYSNRIFTSYGEALVGLEA